MKFSSIFILCFFLLAATHCVAQASLPPVSADTIRATWSGKQKHGQRVGEWNAINAGKTVRVVAHYENGQLNGEWIGYYDGGALLEKGNYVNGKRDGAWVGYYSSKDTLYECIYSNGLVNGVYSEYDKGHQLKWRGNVIDGKRDGIWEYHINLTGRNPVAEYSLSTYVNGALTGLYEHFRNGFLVESLYYKDGMYHGECKWFFPDGKISRSEMYTEGKKDGVRVVYSQTTGQPVDSGRYEMDYPVGYHSHHYSTGNSSQEWHRPVLLDTLFVNDKDHPGQKSVVSVRRIQRLDSILSYRADHTLEMKKVYRDTTAAVWIKGGVAIVTMYDKTGRPLNSQTKIGNTVEGFTTTYYPSGKVKSVLCEKTFGSFPANWYYENGKLRAHDDFLYYDMLSTKLVLYDRKGKVIPESAPNHELMRDSLYVLSPKLKKGVPQVPVVQDGEVGMPTEEVIAPVVDQKNNEVIMFAEEMPSFQGGEEAFQNYLKNNIIYPSDPKDSSITGTVYIYFEVTKAGAVVNTKSQKGIVGHPAFAMEAIRVISASPAWNPGRMNGRAVQVGMTVPVRFQK